MRMRYVIVMIIRCLNYMCDLDLMCDLDSYIGNITDGTEEYMLLKSSSWNQFVSRGQ